MKLGKVGLVPYEKPGSQALFDAFEQRVMDSDGYLLKHGAVVPEKSLMDAFLLSGRAGGKCQDCLDAETGWNEVEADLTAPIVSVRCWMFG